MLLFFNSILLLIWKVSRRHGFVMFLKRNDVAPPTIILLYSKYLRSFVYLFNEKYTLFLFLSITTLASKVRIFLWFIKTFLLFKYLYLTNLFVSLYKKLVTAFFTTKKNCSSIGLIWSFRSDPDLKFWTTGHVTYLFSMDTRFWKILTINLRTCIESKRHGCLLWVHLRKFVIVN